MRKLGWALLCVMMLGGAALAQDTPADAAYKPISDIYVQVFEQAYADAGSGRPAQTASEPPLDVVATLEGERTAAAAIANCASRSAKDAGALIQCSVAALQDFAAAARLRDPALFDALAAATRRLAADAAAKTVRYEAASATLAALTGDFVGMAEAQYVDWLASRAKVSGTPPYDPSAIGAAADAAGRAVTICAIGRESAASLMDCLIDNDQGYNRAIKLTDPAAYNVITAALRRVAADVDAGRIERDEMIDIYKDLHETYGRASEKLYAAYLGRLYVARFDRRYAAATGGKAPDLSIPPYDETAIGRAGDSRDAAMGACGKAPQEGQRANRWIACMARAEQLFADTAKLADRNLLRAYIDTIEEAATDADAGKLSIAQLGAVGTAVFDHYSAALDRQAEAYENNLAKAFIGSYLASFERAYAAARAKDPEEAQLPPFDAPLRASSGAATRGAAATCEEIKGEAIERASNYQECRIKALKFYFYASQWKSNALFDALAATLRQVADDVKAGKFHGARTLRAIDDSLIARYETLFEQHYAAPPRDGAANPAPQP